MYSPLPTITFFGLYIFLEDPKEESYQRDGNRFNNSNFDVLKVIINIMIIFIPYILFREILHNDIYVSVKTQKKCWYLKEARFEDMTKLLKMLVSVSEKLIVIF